MRARLRALVGYLDASYWFLPALLTTLALILSIVTYYIDLRVGVDWLGAISWLRVTKPDGARALLSTISGGMLGVAGTVFSVTIASVVYASGNYGPRLLTNFMTDRGNQLSLGVFIATYLYCLMVLRTVRSPNEDGPLGLQTDGGFVPEISLLVAVALALISVGTLVYFLHHVPDSIRINNVIAKVGRRLVSEVGSRYTEPYGGAEPERRERSDGQPVRAGRTGYIDVIDYDTLADVCERQGVTVALDARTGDFIHPHMPLVMVEGTMGEGVEDDLRSAFAIGDSRTAAQDIEFSIDELVEIGLRALSPGINDPFTAVTCLHWLGAATSAIAGRDLCRDADGRTYGEGRVFGHPDDFEHFVARGFGSMRASVAENAIASRVFVETLASTAYGCAAPARIAVLRNEAKLMLVQAEKVLTGPTLVELQEAVSRFREDLA